MTKLEKLLNNEKVELDKIEVPDDLESKLRNTLNNIPVKKRRSIRGRVAAMIIVVLLLGYNLDTLAFYGKKIIGYDNIMHGTLQELNESGKGQSINKSYMFNNGIEVILDGVMLDDNNMVMFYTIKDPTGNVQDSNFNLRVNAYGFGGKIYTHGGFGQSNEEGTEQKWIIRTHESPRFYERNITLRLDFINNGVGEQGEIKFKLDRSQAVGKSLRIPINKHVNIDHRSFKIQSLVASPTSTVIKGQIQDIVELGIDYINNDRFRPGEIDILLLANGKEVPINGSGMSTDMKGINFYITYDALPVNTEELELKLVLFGGDHDANELVDLVKGETKKIMVLNQDISIDEVYEDGNNTYITITTEEDTALSRVYLIIDGVKVELKETEPGVYDKIEDKENVMIKYTRTLRFEGKGENLALDIQRIRYNKAYDKLIYSTQVK